MINTRLYRKKLVSPAGLLSMGGILLFVSGVSRAEFKVYNVNYELNSEVYRSEKELSNVDISAKQTLLGDVISDAIRTASKTEMAFIQASAFSDSSITLSRMGFGLADILKTLEYKGSTIAVIKISGEQIRTAMENSLSQYPGKNGAFLQTAGLVTSFDPSAPAGKRITSIKLNGAALDNSKTYRIAMSLPLANGASGYFKYWKKTDIEKETAVTLEKALSDYLNEHKTIVKGEDRLVAKSK